MRTSSTGLARLLVAVLGLVVVAVGVGRPVEAHSNFDFSVPTDGASVGEPVSELTVAFTLPVTLVGNGFEVVDPQENLLQPFAVTDDDAIFRLQFDPPLAGGVVGVRYTVTAEDGHALSGSFSFTVSADALPPTTTTSTVAPSTAPPATEPQIAEPSIAEPAATTTVVVTASAGSATVIDATDDSSNSGLVIAIAGIVAVLAAGFVLVRSRL